MPQVSILRWFVQAMVSIFGFGTGLLGVVLLYGGPDRFVSPGFATARLVPGSWVTWGALFLIGGALTLLGASRRHIAWTRAGLLVEAFGFLFLDLSLIATAHQDIHAALTGAVAYAILWASCLALWGAVKELT